MKTIYEKTNGSFPIKLEQYGPSNRYFRVTYGLQVDDHLNYTDAAAKLGQAIMHCAACDNILIGEIK